MTMPKSKFIDDGPTWRRGRFRCECNDGTTQWRDGWLFGSVAVNPEPMAESPTRAWAVSVPKVGRVVCWACGEVEARRMAEEIERRLAVRIAKADTVAELRTRLLGWPVAWFTLCSRAGKFTTQGLPESDAPEDPEDFEPEDSPIEARPL